MSKRFVSETITAIPSSTRSPRRNCHPSRNRTTYGVVSSASSVCTRGIARVAQARTAAERPKLRASTTSASAAPIQATRPPAMAAPRSPEVRSTVECRPVARSIGTPASATTAGVSADLAASPGPRSAPATATSSRNTGNGSQPDSCSSGIAPTASTDSRSQVIATRRAPTRSITGPPRILSRTSGSISASATSPVFVALPVVVSTNHGRATIDTRVPVSEIASAVSQP
ncbi:hypothetical protein GCM10023146_25610 [Nocardioides caricicola]